MPLPHVARMRRVAYPEAMRPVSADIPRRRLLGWAVAMPLLIAAGLGLGVGLPLLDGARRAEETLATAAARITAQGVDDWLRQRRDMTGLAAGCPEIRRIMALPRSPDSLERPLKNALNTLPAHGEGPLGVVMLLGGRDPLAVFRRGADIPQLLWPSSADTETTDSADPPDRPEVVVSGPVMLEGKECLLFSAPVFPPPTDAPARGSVPAENRRRLGSAVLAWPTAGLRSLLDEAPDAALVLDTASGRFTLRSHGSGPPSPAEQAALDAARDGRNGVLSRDDGVYAYARLTGLPGGLVFSAPTLSAAALRGRLPEYAAWGAALCALSLSVCLLLTRPLTGRRLLPQKDLEAAAARDAAAQASLDQTRRRLEETDHRRARLAGELIRMLENMRRALARELHDQAGQMLTTLLLSLETVRRDLESGALSPKQGAAALEGASEAVRRLQTEVRTMAKGLRPPALDALGLVPAVEALGDEYRQAGVDVRFFHDALPALSDDEALTLYRIVQESLTNAARHGHAASVHVNLMGRAGGVALSVEDDGQGFDAAARTEGLGLTLMRERAARLGGDLRVESRPGQGTTIMMDLPTTGEG